MCQIDVTTTLTSLILDTITSHSTLLDTFVILYAAFVSSLHKIIGIEFGVSQASPLMMYVNLPPYSRSRTFCPDTCLTVRRTLFGRISTIHSPGKFRGAKLDWEGSFQFACLVVGTLYIPSYILHPCVRCDPRSA